MFANPKVEQVIVYMNKLADDAPQEAVLLKTASREVPPAFVDIGMGAQS